MTRAISYLALDDRDLLAQCRTDVYKASGPGGQHRNKVSTAIRLRHLPSGVTSHGTDSRSQLTNRKMALKRLRMNLACQLRGEMDLSGGNVKILPVVSECMFPTRQAQAKARMKLKVGKRDQRFWPVAAFLLDLLLQREGSLSATARDLDISTANLAGLLSSEPHLMTAFQNIRKSYGLRPMR